MTIFCYNACSTCKKAITFLKTHSIQYTYRDIKTEPPTKEELRQMHRLSGLDLKKFFNTSGQLYRSLHVKDQLPSMSEEEILTLLSSDGMLVKRPLLIHEQPVLVGFKEERDKQVWID